MYFDWRNHNEEEIWSRRYYYSCELIASIDQPLAQLQRATRTSVFRAKLFDAIATVLCEMRDPGQRWLEAYRQEAEPDGVDHQGIRWLAEMTSVFLQAARRVGYVLPVSKEHEWLRFAGATFPSMNVRQVQGRRLDGLLLRSSTAAHIEMTKETPLYDDMLGVASFSIECELGKRSEKLRELLYDMIDVAMMQPHRGSVPGFLFVGKKIEKAFVQKEQRSERPLRAAAALAPAKRAKTNDFCDAVGMGDDAVAESNTVASSDAATKRSNVREVCDLQYMIVDCEGVRLATIKDCFGQGLAEMVAVLGLYCTCDDEMLTFLPSYIDTHVLAAVSVDFQSARQELTAGAPIVESEVVDASTVNSGDDDEKGSIEELFDPRRKPPQPRTLLDQIVRFNVETSSDLAQPWQFSDPLSFLNGKATIDVLLHTLVNGKQPIFSRRTALYRSATLNGLECAVKLGWYPEKSAGHERRVYRVLNGLSWFTCDGTAPVPDAEFLAYRCGDIFENDNNWKKYIPTLMASRCHDRFEWQVNREETLTLAEIAAKEVAPAGEAQEPANTKSNTTKQKEEEMKKREKKEKKIKQKAESHANGRKAIPLRHVEILVLYPFGSPLTNNTPCASVQAWLECTRTYARYMAQLVSVVQWLFEKEIQHCDITSSNVMVHNGNVLLMDFDNAQWTGPSRQAIMERIGHDDCMAIDLLLARARSETRIPQLARHDLESIIYLFLQALSDCMPEELNVPLREFRKDMWSVRGCVWRADKYSMTDIASTRHFMDWSEYSQVLAEDYHISKSLSELFDRLRVLQRKGLGARLEEFDLPYEQDAPLTFWQLSKELFEAFETFARSGAIQ